MIVGHERNLGYLLRTLERGTLAHAYIFSGPSSVGKKSVAIACAQSLFCESRPLRLGGCGKCASCRSVGALAHPDLIMLGRENLLVPDETKREIGIANIHELTRRLSGTSWSGGWRVAVIEAADELSRDAQVALLKTLEEPGKNIVFFLITQTPGALLPTIRSRSVALSFTTLSIEDMHNLARTHAHAGTEEYIRLADGRPGLFVRMLEDRDFAKSITIERARFEKILSSGLHEQFAFVEKVAKEGGGQAFFEFILDHFHEKLSGSSPGQVREYAERARVAQYHFELFRSTTVNRRLLLDATVFDLASHPSSQPA